MINFILPQAYRNNIFNKHLKEYIATYPEHLTFKEKINIFAQEGNFPFSFWHGGINTCHEDKKIILQNEVCQFANDLNTPLILDFSNQFLDKYYQWIEDPHISMILKTFENRGNYILVNSDIILSTIQNRYPGYAFILKFYQQSFDENNYDLIEGKTSYNNKSIYPLFNKCFYCPQYMECLNQENAFQAMFSKESVASKCILKYPTLKDVIAEYKKGKLMGYHFFYFGDIPFKDLPSFNQFLMEFFIAPEYYGHFQEVLND